MLGTGHFGAQQAGIKIGIVGGGLTAQYIAVRKQPQCKRFATIANFVFAGVTLGLAAHNWRIKK